MMLMAMCQSIFSLTRSLTMHTTQFKSTHITHDSAKIRSSNAFDLLRSSSSYIKSMTLALVEEIGDNRFFLLL